MGPSYDAQRNEFCAYVLPESQTPYGLLLGKYTRRTHSPPQKAACAVCGTPTPIKSFSARINRVPVARSRQPTAAGPLFPHQIERELTFLPYAQISEFTLEHRVQRHRVVLRAARARRSIAPSHSSSTSRSTTPARNDSRSRFFPWAMLVGQRFYGEPETRCARGATAASSARRIVETGGERWWGGSREPAAVELSLREQVLLEYMRRAALTTEAPDSSPWPRLSGRRIFGALRIRARVAPGARESLRLCRRLPQRRRRCQPQGARSAARPTGARCTTRSDTLRAAWPTRDS